MSSISLPYVNMNILTAFQTVPNAPQKVLFVAQKSALGTATGGELVENIGNNNEEDTLFGRRSMLAGMIRHFKAINQISRVDAIPLDDPSVGQAEATATITITGTTTVAGNLSVAVQSRTDHTFTLGVTTTDTGTTIAANLAALINADDTILCTADSGGTNVVTLTATHPGLESNDITIETLLIPTGISVATTAFTGGAGAVTLPDIGALAGDIRYQTIPWLYSYGMDEIKTEITSRFNVSNKILDGVVFTLPTDTDTSAATTASEVLNSQSIVYFSQREVSIATNKGTPIVEFNPYILAEWSAMRALKFTQGSNFAPFLAGSGGSSTSGGTFRAALPYGETPFSNLPVIKNNLGWSSSDQIVLNDGGVSFFGNNEANSEIVCGQVVTTYRTTPGGAPDTTFHYLDAVDIASAIREFMFNNIKAQYVQTVLNNGPLSGAGNPETNVVLIRGFIIGLYDVLAGASYGLVQTGRAAEKYFERNLTVTANLETGEVDASMTFLIVSVLRKFNGTMKIGFSIPVAA